MNSSSHVIVDIGSTTTKAVLFRPADGRWEMVRREAPTTVEAPHEDVKVGLLAALGALEKAAGERILDGDRPGQPILLTSSAGGGLAMVVTGLVKEVTSRSAERAALGAGAVVQDVVALNDGRVPYRKIEDLTRRRPDMVLFAGGFDGDAVSGPVFLAEILRQADLHPKLDASAALPVLYAGNVNARDLVRDTLGDRYLFRDVPNLRPESGRENLEDARAAIHEMFMEHVMSHAPGYGALGAWVGSPILPTPSALARILETATRDSEVRMLVVDIGGATTDVFTAAGGQVFRTVSANLGMSYSALNVAEAGGFETIRQVLGSRIDAREAWNRIGEKHLDPTRLPRTEEDVAVEWALATAAVRLAVRDHLEVLGGARLSRGAEALELRSSGRTPSRRAGGFDPFPLTGYDVVVGSGGVLSHSPRAAAATILANALEPGDPVRLAVDRAFVLPHLGALSRIDEDLARNLFHSLAVVRLGTLIAPVTKARSSTGTVHVVGDGLDAPVGVAEMVALPLPADRVANVALKGRGVKLTGKTRSVEGGELGLVVDTRPRPLASREATLVRGRIEPPSDTRPEIPRGPRLVVGPIRERREMAVPGEVLLAVGDEVEPDTLVGRSAVLLRRPFFLDVAHAIETDAAGLEPHLLRHPGDDVVAGEELAHVDRGTFRSPLSFISPVAGTIERILPDGRMLVREPADHAIENRTVTFARDLGLPPDQAAAWLLVEEGQEVEAGQLVARSGTGPQASVSRSPVRGRVRSIDREYGLVLVTPLRQDLAITAWLPGRVEAVTRRGAVIAAEGTVLRGTWGTGHEAHGTLALDRFEAGAVVAMTGVCPDALERAGEAGVAGLVVGGLDLDRIRAAAPAYPVVLLEGFGTRSMPGDAAAALRDHEGRTALVDGTTELRVGVRRPRVLLPH